MQKFEFSIRTRDGQMIDRLNIAGKDQADAERKLRQMYHYCEIIRCSAHEASETRQNGQVASIEDILSLISK